MTGKCNIIVVYDENNKDKRWLTRQDYMCKSHYRYLIPFSKRVSRLGEWLPNVNEILPLFENDCGVDNHLGILTSDRATKINMYDYLQLSYILKKSLYKFNKRNQRLIKE